MMLQADFFGLPGLADKASVGVEADPSHGQDEEVGGRAMLPLQAASTTVCT